jgi:hypothetical protein
MASDAEFFGWFGGRGLRVSITRAVRRGLQSQVMRKQYFLVM